MSWMHRVLGKDGSSQLAVDPGHFAARVSTRPLEVGALGHYRIGLQSGLLTSATVTAGGTLFSCRWTHATNLMVLLYLRASYNVTTAFTAVQEIGLDAIIARNWTVADSAGTAVTLGANNQKKRTSFGTTLITTAAEMRIGTTTIVGAGTRTLDANPLIVDSGITHDPNVAAATAQIIAGRPQILMDYTHAADHPLIFAQNEGIVVRNTIIFPAAGAARLNLEMGWAEVASY